MINIPSTAGTGAECTVGAVVKNRRGTKSSTVVIGLEVPAVILDSELLLSAPKSVTAWCAIDALSHIPHGKAIAWSLIPIISAQENLCYDQMAALAVYCQLAEETGPKETAADKLILALKHLLEQCGRESGCGLLREEDYDTLTDMINADSINYSPPRTFTDSEIRMLLDQIRRGY